MNKPNAIHAPIPLPIPSIPYLYLPAPLILHIYFPFNTHWSTFFATHFLHQFHPPQVSNAITMHTAPFSHHFLHSMQSLMTHLTGQRTNWSSWGSCCPGEGLWGSWCRVCFRGWFLLRLSLHDPVLPFSIEALRCDDACSFPECILLLA